jgi:hypothetical protein
MLIQCYLYMRTSVSFQVGTLTELISGVLLTLLVLGTLENQGMCRHQSLAVLAFASFEELGMAWHETYKGFPKNLCILICYSKHFTANVMNTTI